MGIQGKKRFLYKNGLQIRNQRPQKRMGTHFDPQIFKAGRISPLSEIIGKTLGLRGFDNLAALKMLHNAYTLQVQYNLFKNNFVIESHF